MKYSWRARRLAMATRSRAVFPSVLAPPPADFGMGAPYRPRLGSRPVTGTSILGHPVQRLEDRPILAGTARYVADLDLPGALSAVFVRSTMAHAHLAGVDTGEAVKMPGVVAVYTAGDLDLPDIPPFAMAPPAMARPPLARGIVRHVGEPVAVVVAETTAQAADAAGEVIVDYDPLPAVADAEAALADGAPVLYPDHGSNQVVEFDFGRTPDVFEGADRVVTARIRNQRLAPVPLEVNGVAVVPETAPDGAERLTLWVSNQHPFGVRDPLAGLLGLPAENIRVACPAVGGGFGAKIGLYAEYAVVAAAARRLGRPVRWVETRSESMTALVHGRGQIQDIEIGARADGTIVGLRGHLTADVGAYRGAGRPEAAAMIERAVDLVAAELGLDPVDVRRRNLIPRFDQP